MDFDDVLAWLCPREDDRVHVSVGSNETNTSMNIAGVLVRAPAEAEVSTINRAAGRRSLWMVGGAVLALLEGDIDEVEQLGHAAVGSVLVVSCGEQQVLLFDVLGPKLEREPRAVPVVVRLVGCAEHEEHGHAVEGQQAVGVPGAWGRFADCRDEQARLFEHARVGLQRVAGAIEVHADAVGLERFVVALGSA